MGTPERLDVDSVAGRQMNQAAITLDASNVAPRQARDFVRATFNRWRLGGVSDVACLLAGELVTNVVRHVGGSMSLRVEHVTDTIVVEVFDRSTEVPIRRVPEPSATSGRGLMLLDALAQTWGISPGTGGKVVWFSLPAPRVRGL